MINNCKVCGKRVCNCPPNKEIGCIVPCIENNLDFPLGFFPGTCTDLRTSNIDSARLVITTPTPEGSLIVWHRDTVNNPASFDLTPTFNIRAILDAADTLDFDGNRPYYYELYVVFTGEVEEILLLTGRLCVEKLKSMVLAPMGIEVDCERTGRHFVFTVSVDNPHESYTLKEYQWNFGDGVTQTTLLDTISHLYSEDGEFNVCVNVVYETTLATSINPCATEIETEFCFDVEPCVLDLNLPPNPIPVTTCSGRFLDKNVFYNNFLVTGLVVFPITYDISLTYQGEIIAQNTLLTIERLSDVDIDGSNNIQNIANFLNNLNTPLGFNIVTNGAYTGLEIESPSPIATYTLRIVKSYSSGDEYIYTESGYTGDVFLTPVVWTCV